MAWLARVIGLDRVEREIITIAARAASSGPWEDLVSLITSRGHSLTAQKLAMLTGNRATEVEDRLRPGGRLIVAGLIDDQRDGEYGATEFLNRVARSTTTNPNQLVKWITPAAPRSTLGWSDFAHVGARDLVHSLVASGQPLNILLHGEPGTGKSEFARILADITGREAVFAGLADDEGGEPRRSERLAHLALLRALTRADHSRFIVVDEADDVLLLHRGGPQDGSKIWLNRLLEDSEVTTVWIVNDASALGAPVLRRMHAAVRFSLPPPSVRTRVIERASAAAALVLDPAEIARLAALPAAPALLASAVSSAKIAQGGNHQGTAGARAFSIAAGVLDAMGASPSAGQCLPKFYDQQFVAADYDLAETTERLASAPDRGWSLLLAGPPGTGKTAWAHYLAGRLGVEVDEHRGSDLLDCFVGGTEKRIAAAFRSAAARGALLLIDEADAVLFDRQKAERSWETSMVAELLRAMEHHPAPFVATTNFSDYLDRASRRRFTMAITFRPLSDSQAATLFAQTFDQELPRDWVLKDTVPGDFALVSKRARLLGMNDPAIIAGWIISEVDERAGGKLNIGFARYEPLS